MYICTYIFFEIFTVIMSLPSDSADTMFSGCPSTTLVCSFVRTDLFTIISRERLEKCRWNLQGIFIYPTDDLVRFWRSQQAIKWQRHPHWCCGIEVHLVLLWGKTKNAIITAANPILSVIVECCGPFNLSSWLSLALLKSPALYIPLLLVVVVMIFLLFFAAIFCSFNVVIWWWTKLYAVDGTYKNRKFVEHYEQGRPKRCCMECCCRNWWALIIWSWC